MAQVKLGDVAVESRETYKGDKTGMPIVGLEHITPGEITLSNWDTDTDNTFTKRFRKGDMLFGRRRAYLKKAAQAPFDGICSGDITVIRAQKDLLLPELLPFIIQNDNLFDFAVGKSAGSLSPRVKWDNLKNYTFELPPMEEQRKLAAVLWSINDTLQAYQKLFTEMDALVQAQFVEMFGDPRHQKDNLTNLGEHINLINGFAFKSTGFVESGIPVIKIANVNRADFTPGSMQFYDYQSSLERYIVKPGDVLLSLTGTVGKDDFGNCCIVDNSYSSYYLNQRNAKLEVHTELVPEYLLYLLKNEYIRGNLIKAGTGVRQCHLHNKDIESIRFVLPKYDLQKKFAAFTNQVDKSKSILLNTVTSLQTTKRSILERALGTGRKE